jgi:RNA polymerase sigma-70 factor (ECF subfamily)
VATGDSTYHTRPSLVVRVRDPGDREAWTAFVALYGPLVYGYGRRKGLGHQDAEDVAQAVFAQVAVAMRSFTYRPEVGRFRDWLGAAARNAVYRFLRKASREARGRGGDGDDVLDRIEDRGEDADWAAEFTAHVLQAALARCRPHFEADTWRAFELVWLEKQPATRAAEELGRPLDWVYVAKSRVLKRLWEEVRELADDAPLGLAGPD